MPTRSIAATLALAGRTTAACLMVTGVLTASAAERTAQDLQVFYDFRDPVGNIVKDRSGNKNPINLTIANPKAVTRSPGTLQVLGNTTIRSAKPAARLSEAIRRSGEFTVETWLQPANTTQEGPARVVTLSPSTSERLFTLGQEKHQFDVRFRTNKTQRNGTPSLTSPGNKITTQLTHVVYTRSPNGITRLFLDGRKVTERKVNGDLAPWKQAFPLGIGNENNGQRPWLGTFHLVAIYSRSLSPVEITTHFQAGPDAGLKPLSPTDQNAHLFEKKVAALLANHCIECHDPATREGKLDLSRQSTAFENKDTIIPGNAHDSILWEAVASDDMPEDRPPLSPDEKKLLRQWIDGGAKWSVDVIDPANYQHAGKPQQLWVRRLTVPEYIETVRAALGVDITAQAHEFLPPDLRADGFSNTAYNLSVDLAHIDAYARLAGLVVEQIDVTAFAKRFSPHRNVNDKDMLALLAAMGNWLLRGPLEEEELTIYRGITTTVVTAGGDFEEAVAYTIEAMLQSPRFIYRIEKQRGNGFLLPVSDAELASRLSYTLWGAPPDQELFSVAEKGELTNPAKIEAQARRMLKDPRAIDQSVRFLTEWLNLDRLDHIQPNASHFPDWNPALAADMRDETIAFFKEIVWKQKRPLTDLLNAPVTFVTPRLAQHYRLPLAAETPAAPGDLLRVNLSTIPSRGGLLTHGSVLTMGGDEASMVTRGLFVFNDLLRGTVNNPPPNLNIEPVPTKPGLTHRDVAQGRISDRNCGDCHEKFEPMAFGLEKFDGLGTWREIDEHGNRLRDDGEVLIPGTEKPVPYQNSAELMNVLAQSDRVAETLTWKLAQFVLGRPLTADDVPALKAAHQKARQQGGTYQNLITTLLTSDLIRKTPTTKEN